MIKYNILYPNSLTSGVGLISDLATIDKIPWHEMSGDDIKDIERAYNVHSGFKDVIDTFLIVDGINRAKLISAVFSQKWSKLWKDYTIEYDPLHAYIVEETGNGRKKVDDTHTDNFGRVTDSNSSNTGTVGNIINEASENNLYGFNSNDPVPANTGSVNSNDTETRNLATTGKTTNSGSDTRTIDGLETEEHSLTKKGNIGYSTPQKLLREDLELWVKPFFMTVFNDIDDFIMCQVHSI